jgi:hypothetical protein
MRSIGDLIANLMAGLGAAEVLPYAAIRSAWRPIVGTDLARVCRPESLSGGTLTVIVSHPTWVQHLVFLKETLLANIRREVPEASVAAVVFRVGKVGGEKRSAKARSAPPPLTGEEELAIERAIAEVRDPEVRGALRGVLRSALAAAPDRLTAGAADSPRS